MEQTLIVFKPDAVSRGIVGEILCRFEKAGLKIVGLKMVAPDEKHYFDHYETIGGVMKRHGEKIYRENIDYMMMGPVVAVVLEGVEAVESVRKMVGPTEPKAAAPGTIRGDYAHMSRPHANAANIGLPNLLHASGDSKEAQAEIKLWFAKDELVDYEAVHEQFTQTKKK